MNNNKKTKKPLITALSYTFAVAAYFIADAVMASQAPSTATKQVSDNLPLASIEQVTSKY